MLEIGSKNLVLSLKILLFSRTREVFSTFPVGGEAAKAAACVLGVAFNSLFRVC